LKADVNASRHTDGATPLYAAAENRHTCTEVVKVLLGNKADLNARISNSDKPVDAARRNHHSDIVELLK